MTEPPPSPPLPPRVPAWLGNRLQQAGGSVPFHTYMDWALHDPLHGAYGQGRLQVGPKGDFATSPSLGPDFAALLAPQVAQWLQGQSYCQGSRGPGSTAGTPGERRPLALVELGPGEGHLAQQLALCLSHQWPSLAALTELVLVEPNAGMADRQRQRLADCPLPCRWTDLDALGADPVQGVVLAHEVLDALAVERIVWDGHRWCQQRVALQGDGLALVVGAPLDPHWEPSLEALGLLPPHPQRGPGWTTELHPGLGPWMGAVAAGLRSGHLLVVDYAHDASRYYAPQRRNGTLMAYCQQRATDDPLQAPGHWDLTAHLCLESLLDAAVKGGWRPLGQRRQGEALLALGLAQRLHGLQHQPGTDLGTLLARRETLLRLVDPAGLGEFRWIALDRLPPGPPGPGARAPSEVDLPLFLGEPVGA